MDGKITEMTFINTCEATVTGDAIVGTVTGQPHNAHLPATGRVRTFERKREKAQEFK